jgi:hypothetical protein
MHYENMQHINTSVNSAKLKLAILPYSQSKKHVFLFLLLFDIDKTS